MAEKKEKIIYISGHRNPDTDSICSAMALADLKNKISARQVADEHADRVVYKAVRAGHLNQETRYVMKAFDVTAPTYMRDARTQIKDIFDDKTQSVSGNISLRQAWKTMRAVKKATLAITDSKIIILILINVLLLIVGMIMEANAAIVMLAPILVPLVSALGMTTVPAQLRPLKVTRVTK